MDSCGQPAHPPPWVGSLPAALGDRAYAATARECPPCLRQRVEHLMPLERCAGVGGSCGALLRSRGPRSGRFYVMPNIKQQKKRVRTAARERARKFAHPPPGQEL